MKEGLSLLLQFCIGYSIGIPLCILVDKAQKIKFMLDHGFYNKFSDVFNSKLRKTANFKMMNLNKKKKVYAKSKKLSTKLDYLNILENCYIGDFASIMDSKEEIDFALALFNNDHYYKKIIIANLNKNVSNSGVRDYIKTIKFSYLNDNNIDFYSKRDVILSLDRDNFILIANTGDCYLPLCEAITKFGLSDNEIMGILNSNNTISFAEKGKIISFLSDDNIKADFLVNIDEQNKKIILASFKDISLRNIYLEIYNISINSILVVQYNNLNTLEEKNKFLSKLNKQGLDEDIYSNNNKEEILKKIEVKKDLNLDDDITFGIELEASNIDCELYKTINHVLDNWIIRGDASVDNSTEIVSPILHFTEEDLKQIKYICDFMKKYDFKTNDKCGGHIHIGLKYFGDPNELKMLYYLFCNCEKIFYLITNRKKTLPRNGAYKYSYCISNIINDKQNDIDNIITKEELITYLKSIQGRDRYSSVNILNANSQNKDTIEFRYPNGEIDYEEIKANIVLLVMLANKAKVFTHMNSNDTRWDKIKELENIKDDDIKVEVLLDLLFEDNPYKEIYIERYKENSKLLKILSNNSLKRMMFNNVKFDKTLTKKYE